VIAPAHDTRQHRQSVSRVGVVGCGLMGSGIAEVFARARRHVAVHEVDAAAVNRGYTRIETSLQRGVKTGKLTSGDAASVLARIPVGADLDALTDSDLCIEAANEDEALKVDLFRRLDKIVTADEAILAANTSSVPIMKLDSVTQ
jgi:3-hydroxybutyryl-CoA dehydrogenase